MINLTVEEQEQIYEHYGVVLYKPVSSPLRDDDNNPSFSTKLIDGSVKWSDFGLGMIGQSVYDFVMEIEGVDFKGAIKIIKNVLNSSNVNIRTQTPRKQVREKVLKVVPNNTWDNFEANYWSIRGISVETCKRNLIFPLKLLFIDGRFICTSTKENPKFIYYFDSENKSGFKVYSPLDKNFKWLSYNISLYNLENKVEKKYDDLIVFSGRKDRLVFDTLNLPYDTTSTMAEGNFNGLLKELPNLHTYKNIYSFFDFELNSSGENLAKKLYEQSNKRVVPITPPLNILNYLITQGIKDIDDLKVKGGDELLSTTIRQCLC